MIPDDLDRMERETASWIEAMDQDPLIGRVGRGDASREEYVTFLGATYHYVRWSGPLLARTAEGIRRRGRYPWLAAIVERKTREESPHDRWILRDLARCGVNPELVKAAEPPTAVGAYVAFGLALADDGSPALLGAAYALEAISDARAGAAAQRLGARRGIPGIEGAVSFLAGHGEADAGHVAVLRQVFQRIDEPGDRAAIALSASVLRALYPRFFAPRAGAPGVAGPALVAA
jgi:pyrroloquinoline quinone (PQQ) biosynthesis protein C